MAEGTAINNVSNTKNAQEGVQPGYKHMVRPNQEGEDGDRKSEPTMAIYPKMGLRELIESTSETIPT
jgi:hypothetical protein